MEKDANATLKGVWVGTNPEVTTKQEKIISPVVLYEATDKHPAQIKEISKDIVVGSFTKTVSSGAITSRQSR